MYSMCVCGSFCWCFDVKNLSCSLPFRQEAKQSQHTFPFLFLYFLIFIIRVPSRPIHLFYSPHNALLELIDINAQRAAYSLQDSSNE